MARFAWAGIKRFQNIGTVVDLINALHSPPASQQANVKKQATQIRYCLTQAKEYYDAASAVSLATRPTLLYYSCMHLALAEILLKQDGASSLDVARAQNKHHGLTLVAKELAKGTHSFKNAADSLIAKPLEHADGSRFGTFDLWHRSAREVPMHGLKTNRHATGTTNAYGLVLIPEDVRLPLLPSEGISLLQCLRSIPGLEEQLFALHETPNIVRGRVTLDQLADGSTKTAIVIHPNLPGVLSKFYETWKIEPSAVNKMDFAEIGSGLIISWTIQPLDYVIGNLPRIMVPQGMMWHHEEVRFWSEPGSLNEFGYLYSALYIVGNYARYYPDRWMRDVEEASSLALVVEHLLDLVGVRMPLLAYSELSRICWVPKD